MNTKHKNLIVGFGLAVLILSNLYSCSKHADVSHSVADSTKTSIPGSIYAIVNDSLQYFNVKTGAKVWSVPASYYGNPSGPLVFNAGSVYNAGSAGTKCFNGLTGAGVWELNISDPSISQFVFAAPAFPNDSVAVVNSSTGVYIGGAMMYGYNKNTGKRMWSTQIDSAGGITDNYFAIPLAVNKKIVVLVKEYSGNFKICCYDPATGKQLWQSDWNPYLSSALKTSGGNIFSLQGATIWGYSGNNGAMLWQTTVPITSGSQYYGSYFDDTNLYISRLNPDGSFSVLTVNKLTGQYLSTTTVPLAAGALAPYACHYQNGVFYVMDYIDTSTDYNGMLYAYSFPSMQLKWSYKFTWLFSPSRAPVITDRYVVFPVSADKIVNQNSLHAKMVFLDMNGKTVNELKYPGFTSKFLYIDDAGIPYMTDAY